MSCAKTPSRTVVDRRPVVGCAACPRTYLELSECAHRRQHGHGVLRLPVHQKRGAVEPAKLEPFTAADATESINVADQRPFAAHVDDVRQFRVDRRLPQALFWRVQFPIEVADADAGARLFVRLLQREPTLEAVAFAERCGGCPAVLHPENVEHRRRLADSRGAQNDRVRDALALRQSRVGRVLRAAARTRSCRPHGQAR